MGCIHALRLFLSVLALSGASASSVTVADEGPDFAHAVVPIIKSHCVECHGGREAKGGFSLNTRSLMLESGHVIPGDTDSSYLLELIGSDDPEIRMPPPDHAPVPPSEQKILTQWIAAGAAWESGWTFSEETWEPPLRPRRPDLPAPVTTERTHPVDRLLDHWMQEREFALPPTASDPVFLRRVSLDLHGLLPSPELQEWFRGQPEATRRGAVIDRLLADDVACADHWLTFYNDLLRNDYSGTGFITGGRKQISGWLYEALQTNKPWDLMVRELVAPPSDESRGFLDGIRWRGTVSAGQTVEIQFSQNVSQAFLGINMKCASCHDSFISRWKLDDAYALAAVSAEQSLEIHRCDKPIGRTARAGWLFPELGQIDASAPRKQRLQQLASLLTNPENGRFARTLVNRVWYRLMGRGLVHPVDAMESRPWNEDLLDWLATDFADHGYDLQHLYRRITTSKAYQATACEAPPGDRVDDSNAGCRPWIRRMTAEQFLDNLWIVTGTGPAAADAPVRRVASGSTDQPAVLPNAQWIWGPSAAEGPPAAGDRYTLQYNFTLPVESASLRAVFTCDNSCQLYLNGRRISEVTEWTKPASVILPAQLPQGRNTITAVVTNAGSTPNPAGFYFDGFAISADGLELVRISSNAAWKVVEAQATEKNGLLSLDVTDKANDATEKANATVVSAVAPWQQLVDGELTQMLNQVRYGRTLPSRASLMKNTFLMKSLGRPLRDQVVSMRPTELTTLEAIDLSNGSELAALLQEGAQALHSRRFPSTEELLSYLYEYCLSRPPTATELKILSAAIGDAAEPESIEDLLWSVAMLPEFFLIR